LSFFTIPPWVRPDFAREYHMRERGRANLWRMFSVPTEASWNSFMLATISGDWYRSHLAAPLGLNLSHPFKDPRLVRYTLGLPRNIRGDPTQTKPLLELAMAKVLPEPIRTKKCSPGFDDIYGRGLRRNMLNLEQLLKAPAFLQLGIIDIDKVVPLLRQAALGIGDAQATDRLDKTLALAAWFDHISHRGPRTPNQPLHVSGAPSSASGFQGFLGGVGR
jgi:asparagine synthase (glutamine-hydrolysing)